jgi:hypothetical protein
MKKAILFIPALLFVFLVQASSSSNMSNLACSPFVSVPFLVENVFDIDHSLNIKEMPGKRRGREKRAERKLRRKKEK